jgi:D-aspartate ligase
MRRWTGKGRASPRSGERPLACVLGEIDLVRALALAGVHSAVGVPPGNPARYSRAAAYVLDWRDPCREPEALLERLVAFGRTQPQRPVLFYDGDWDTLLISRHREELSESFRFVIAESELVESLLDKERFQGLAERLGLPVPRSRRLADADDEGALGLRFPLLAKPLTREHGSWRPHARAKALPVAGAEDLRSLRARLRGSGLELLVQEAVPGPESRVVSYHVYVDEGGEVAGEFTGRKLRTHPPLYGYSTALEITASEEVTAAGREIVRQLGLRGVAKLDFKCGPDGTLHLFEVNPRFNLWHHPGALAGVNLPEIVYRDLVGLPRPPVRTARSGVRWCSLAHDPQAARADGTGLARWVAWALRCEAKSGFAWDDPLPLPRAALWRLRRRARTGAS